jgi:hypothetical protein
LTRAYFTAATCAISLFKILSIALNKYNYKFKVENTPPQFLINNTKNINLKQCKDTVSNNNKGELIIWNHPGNSFLRTQRGILTKQIRDNIFVTNYHKSIMIGLLLSDGWIQRRLLWNPRIALKQSIKNFEYLWSVFNILSVYCSSYPYSTKNIKRGKLFFSLEFQTRQLKSLNEIYNLFYFENNKIKSITPELFHYIDYIAIAHWIMGDGAKRNKGIILCTDCFTIKEVVILMNILLIKFDIKSTIHYDNNYPRIYINKVELNKIKSQIKPYFVNRFLYKLNY